MLDPISRWLRPPGSRWPGSPGRSRLPPAVPPVAAAGRGATRKRGGPGRRSPPATWPAPGSAPWTMPSASWSSRPSPTWSPRPARGAASPAAGFLASGLDRPSQAAGARLPRARAGRGRGELPGAGQRPSWTRPTCGASSTARAAPPTGASRPGVVPVVGSGPPEAAAAAGQRPGRRRRARPAPARRAHRRGGPARAGHPVGPGGRGAGDRAGGQRGPGARHLASRRSSAI